MDLSTSFQPDDEVNFITQLNHPSRSGSEHHDFRHKQLLVNNEEPNDNSGLRYQMPAAILKHFSRVRLTEPPEVRSPPEDAKEIWHPPLEEMQTG